MGEGNFVAVGVGAIDVVETHRDLRDNFESALAGLENLSINGVTQSGDQAINSLLNFFDDQLFRRRLRAGIDFELVLALAKYVFGFVADVAGGVNAKAHCFRDFCRPRRQSAPVPG